MFKFYDYVPPFGNEVERPRDNFFDPDSKKSKTQVLNQTLGAYNSSVAFSAKEAEGYKTIILYMPEDIQMLSLLVGKEKHLETSLLVLSLALLVQRIL